MGQRGNHRRSSRQVAGRLERGSGQGDNFDYLIANHAQRPIPRFDDHNLAVKIGFLDRQAESFPQVQDHDTLAAQVQESGNEGRCLGQRTERHHPQNFFHVGDR
jgi:hypothetical protein